MADTTADDQTAWSTSGKYNCTPPIGKLCTIHKERFWISGNTTYKSDLYFSDDGNPDFFDPDDFFEIRADDGDEITFVKPFLGILTIGKTNTVQKVYTDGSTTSDWYQSDPFSFVGCPAPYSASVTPLGIFYVGRHGLYKFTGQTSDLISDAVTPEINDISQADIAECVGIYYNNEYRLAYTSSASGNAYNNRVLIYNLIRDSYSIDYENVNCWCEFSGGTDFGGLYSGSSYTDGYVLAHSPTTTAVSKRYKSEVDAGTFDDARTTGTEEDPHVELAWDCTIAGWLTELQTKNANITTIADIKTYMPTATIARPDTNGTWTSPAYRIDAQDLGKLYWNENLGATGDVTWAIRLNSTSTMSGAYSTAVTNPNGSDMSGTTADAYIQLKSTLSTTDINFSPLLYQSDGYIFKLLYSKIGSLNETSVLSVYKTGWKTFTVPGYKKQIDQIKVFYKGTTGTVTFNIKGDDGDIDKTFNIDLSVAPDVLKTDRYTGSGAYKVFTYNPPMNSTANPSPISQAFQFTITENGTTGWEINRIEVQFHVLELY
jgi:hypothetical protein